MIQHLRALVSMAVDDDRAALWRLALNVIVTVGADFLVIYALLGGLEQRNLGARVGQQALLFFIGVVGFCFFTFAVNSELNVRFSGATCRIINFITRRLPRLPLLEYERLDRGMLITRVLGDGNQIASSRQAVFGVLNGGLRLLLGGVFAISISPESSLAAFVGLLFIAAVAAGQMRVLRAGFGEVAQKDARMYEILRGQLDGGVALKVHRPRAQALSRAFSALSREVRAMREGMFTAFYNRQFAGDALVYGLLGLNAFALPLLSEVSSEDIRELNLVILWLVLAAIKLALGMPRIVAAGAALTRLRALQAMLAEDTLEPEVAAEDRDGGPFAGFERIELDGLCFQYPQTPARPAFPLGPVDLRLRRRELVFVTGHNGSGKSTFARVLTGLYPWDGGRILVDGRAVNEATLGAWRSLFGVIFVDHCLFERVHGLDEAAQRRAPALFDELGIAHKVAIVDGRVSNRALSTGQRKRLALALAWLRDKPIMVFDEWAADQDPEFRELFYTKLLPRLRDEGRLVIAITHDDQYFRFADRQLRFVDGAVYEESA